MTHPRPDCFRIGEVWESPRGKRWKVERIDYQKGAFFRAMHNRYTTQWRNELAVGANVAWLRIDPPHETP